ncbi:alpha/beta hydrolase [Pendulispora rubella]|uniref:Alpha/beta hydrolase n=1 Tax=Pendulispora rubella TaxID=2741070 RepID=A0ABZ2LFE8_9BACT
MVDIKVIGARSGNLEIAVRVAGHPDRPAIVLIHGWPQSSRAFSRVMQHLADEFYVLAPDLPGVGASRVPAASGSKSLLARHVRDVVQACGARRVVVAGHDVGGMIAFAYVRGFAAELEGVVIVNTVIPGLEPAWSKVLSNPYVWHFAFHSIPKMPEVLVSGHQRPYFDFFFDAISRTPKAITDEARDAYARDYGHVEALRAGFDWYRAMSKDAEENAKRIEVTTPVLNVRGDADPGPMRDYLEGLSASGLTHVRGETLEGSGHFAAEEAPEALARLLRIFARDCVGAV